MFDMAWSFTRFGKISKLLHEFSSHSYKNPHAMQCLRYEEYYLIC